ncbi:MAG: ATP-binding protein [Coriobacteriales bacterium]|jgi:Cdc6-like AAA superfamily ATPase|nr:ATP-binding protein [Coriobacteriales bacterium]
MASEAVFLPAFGNRPSHLVGRDEIVDGFVRGLRSPVGNPERATLLIGRRGMGKTALLLAFAESAESQGFLVARVTAGDEMLADIVGTIQRKGTPYIKKNPQVKGVSAGALGFAFGLTFSDEVERSFSFLNKMALLCDALEKHDKGIVLLVDEIQAHTPSLRILTTTYQHLVGEGKNVVIAMAGLPHAISSLLNDEVLTFLNRARKNRLGPLSLSAVSLYYSSVFDGLGKSISPENLARAVEATRGYPYLLQLIGYYLLEYSGNSKGITGDQTEQALASAKHDLTENIYAPVLKPLSARDRQFLQAMSKTKGPVRVTDIEKRMRTTRGNVQAYRRRLMDAGVIASEQRGELELVIPYLGEYLRREF